MRNREHERQLARHAGQLLPGCPEAGPVFRVIMVVLGRDRYLCQRSLGNPVGRSRFLRAGGHQFSRLVVGCSLPAGIRALFTAWARAPR